MSALTSRKGALGYIFHLHLTVNMFFCLFFAKELLTSSCKAVNLMFS